MASSISQRVFQASSSLSIRSSLIKPSLPSYAHAFATAPSRPFTTPLATSPPKYEPLPNRIPPKQLFLSFSCTSNNIIGTLATDNGEMRADATRTPSKVLKGGSFSGGLVGFKHKARGGYEPGYRCARSAFQRIKEEHEKNGPVQVHLMLAGFGQGREAIVKTLMTSEWDGVRGLINRVTDRTRVKIGGTRAKKQRIL